MIDDWQLDSIRRAKAAQIDAAVPNVARRGSPSARGPRWPPSSRAWTCSNPAWCPWTS